MTFYLLALSILCVFPYGKVSIIKQPLWLWLMGLSVVSGYVEQHIEALGLVGIVVYVALYHGALYIKQPIMRAISSTAFITSSLALAMHVVPGFNNLPIVINELITSDAIPYTLYANFDKGMAGLLVCAYFFSKSQTTKALDTTTPLTTASNTTTANIVTVKTSTITMLKQPFFIIICTVLATLTVALMIGLVGFSPKVPDFWLAFIAINLLFTCVAEEAFFRGLLQTKLSQLITVKRLAIFTPLITAAIFALAHFIGGWSYVLVSGVAGFGYSYVFYKTQRLEWAILCHWLVNISHFFLFTYPMIGEVAPL
ncbi:CPBP family intramembrane glutamic endopeptidase [Psychromonas sp. SR45-3]|uniref:CPBP family intramembrane glutamic endopeptidase n=1 Tax=Psychromonas sp. SR45-3 TaxID=2760930 RepID=UPI0015F9EBFC|nr:CPBP family intramembrane glutamic endopeptidase [Psychromonas sp. SR45-3]MBB1273488.1 CPBP family intramembrane metalloprotease [Psychromonas sp. SR45-3]